MYSQSLIDSVANERKALLDKINNAKLAIAEAQAEYSRLLEADKLLSAVLSHGVKKPVDNNPPQVEESTIKEQCFLIIDRSGREIRLSEIMDQLKTAGKKHSLNGVRAAIKSLILCNRVEKVRHGIYKKVGNASV